MIADVRFLSYLCTHEVIRKHAQTFKNRRRKKDGRTDDPALLPAQGRQRRAVRFVQAASGICARKALPLSVRGKEENLPEMSGSLLQARDEAEDWGSHEICRAENAAASPRFSPQAHVERTVCVE